jgi:predicted lipid-binding transport protein (Tim44 family)
MAGGVITAGIIGGVGGLLGSFWGLNSQAQSLSFKTLWRMRHRRRQKKTISSAAEGIGSGVNQIFLAPEADITRQLAASKYKFGQGFDLEQAAESSAKARQATESMSPLQQSFANLLIQKNAEKERLGDSENNKLAAMFGPIGSGAALAGKYGLFGGGGAY